MARPRQPSTTIRTQVVALRVTEDERGALHKRAVELGISVSDLLHRLAFSPVTLSHSLETTIEQPHRDAANSNTPLGDDSAGAFELARQLRAIGVNINQIARHANTFQAVPGAALAGAIDDLEPVLNHIERHLDRLS